MKAFRAGVSAIALGSAGLLPVCAWAQDTAADQPAAAPAPGEIVVTALRRDQALSKAPVAIAAVSGAQLANQGVTTAKDLQNVVPNVQVGPAGFAIRGVASSDFTEKGDPSTAFNLDGIYIARPTEQSLTMFDVARVEVLRGPQGTLYGRNATAGVVNVISNRPSDRFEASASGEYGNYNTVRLNGMVNTPLGDNVALRLAGAYNFHDGYTKTHDGHASLDDQNDFGLRASLLFHLGDATTLFVSGDYEQSHTNGAARVAASRALAQNDDHSLRYQNPGFDTYSRFNAGGAAVELNSDLGFAKLTYLFGYRKSTWRDRVARNDIPAPFNPFTPNGDFANFQNHDQDSHELRLASQGSGPLQWVLGAYYFHESTYTAPNLLFPNFGFRLLYDLNASAKTYAAFGQVTYSLTPGVRVTGGIRYTNDKKSRTGTQTFVSLDPSNFCYGNTFCASPFDGQYPGGGISGSKVTWKGGLEADLTRDILGYVNVTSGYKAGGFNDGSPADASPVPFYYRPETIVSYEAGVKGTAFDRALYFSLTGFVYDYKGLQLGLVKNTGGAVTLNIPKAHVKGIELEGNYRLGANTKIDYSAALLDATYGDFYPLQGNTAINFKGTPLDRSPKFNGRIGLTQDVPLGNGGRISATAALKYSSSYVVTDGNTATQIRQTSYTRTDLTLGYFAPEDRWFVQAYGRNLENKRLLGVFEVGSFTLTDPLQYGVRAGFKF
ncbi:MAG: TonB-dependent receptor [Proteobacteria bacterium]|nr:TonB-dependent receptor [Pseudomonadota bacterium]